jgi:hypothetical protein
MPTDGTAAPVTPGTCPAQRLRHRHHGFAQIMTNRMPGGA